MSEKSRRLRSARRRSRGAARPWPKAWLVLVCQACAAAYADEPQVTPPPAASTSTSTNAVSKQPMAEPLAPAPALPSGAELEIPISAPGYTNYWQQGLSPELPFAGGGAMPSSGVIPGLAGTSQLSGVAPAPGIVTTGPSPLRLGRLQMFPHVSYQLSYGNSLQSGPGQRTDTFVHELAPGMQLQWGDHWSLDYTPTLRYYSSSQLKDGVDHSVILTGRTTYQEWVFGLSQAYGSSSQPLIETGAQTDQEIHSTAFSATRQLNDQWSMELGANQMFRFVGGNATSGQFSDVRGWSTLNWLNHQFNSWLGAGVGIGAGYDDVSIGSDDLYQQLQGRVTLTAGRKLSFSLAGGAENRQFMNSPAPNLTQPIFSVSGQYRLFDSTMLFFSGSQQISASYFESSASEVTSISAGLRQRLLKYLSLDLTGGYNTTSYHGTSSGPGAAPASDYQDTWVNVALSTTIRRRGTASVFFTQRDVSSGAAIYSYTTSQFGFQLAYRF